MPKNRATTRKGKGMLTLFRRGGAWWFRLRLSSGLDMRRSTGEGDKGRAELAALRIVAGLDQDGLRPARRPGVSLSQLEARHAEWTATRHTPASIRRTAFSFLALSRFMGSDTIPDAGDAERFIQARARDASAGTANVDLRTLRAAFNVAVSCGWIAENPFQKVKAIRVPKTERATLDAGGLRAVLDMARDMGGDMDLAVHLAGLAGLRAGEVAAASWDWFDFTAGTITVRCDSRFTPKGKRSRTVPLHPELVACLLRHRRDLGRVLRAESVPRKPWKLIQDTLAPGVCFHGLRHSCASLWAANGVPPFLIQAWLGHSSISTTEGYVHCAAIVDPRFSFGLPEAPAQRERA